MRELERVVDQKGLRINCQQKWKAIYPRVLTQAKLETRRKSVKQCLDVGKNFKGKIFLMLFVILFYCCTCNVHCIGSDNSRL